MRLVHRDLYFYKLVKCLTLLFFFSHSRPESRAFFTAFLDTLMPRLYNYNVYMRIPYFRGSPGPSTGYTAFLFI